MSNLNLEKLRKDCKYKLQKSKKAVSLALASISLFTVLTSTAQAATLPDTNTTVLYASTTSARVKVIDIVDTTIGTNIVLPSVLEKIYSDGKNDYYLGSPKSHLIVVKYSNGTTKNIVQALNDGDITINTLKNYGIQVYTEKTPTITAVVDRSGNKYVPQVLELIYQDSKNEYYLPVQKSSYIIVKYSNGTEKNIIQALNDGDLTINELQNTYKVKLYTQKRPTVKSVVDKSGNKYLPQVLEFIYRDDKNDYYLPVQKSSYITVQYTNGTEKNIIQALNDGDLTISELQNTYKIPVITKARTTRISSIVDMSKESGIKVPQVKELIYCDGEMNYYFSEQKSGLVIVNYVDGTQKNIVQALRDKDLTIGDLQLTYNISVTIEKVNAENNYYRPGTLYKAPDGTYWTSQKEYEDWNKSQNNGYQYQYKK